MKYLTLNVHSLLPITGLDLTWEERLEMLAETIHREKYDVIALQEINQSIDSPIVSSEELSRLNYTPQDNIVIKEDNAALAVIKSLKTKGSSYYFTYTISHVGYSRFEEGTAILSIHPPKMAVTLSSSQDAEKNNWTFRRQCGFIFEPENVSYAIFSVHFGWWNTDAGLDGFKDQWDRTLDLLSALKVDQIFMLGDFNGDADVTGETYEYITKEHGYYDAVKMCDLKEKVVTVAGKIDGWNEDISYQLDYIFSNKPFYTSWIRSIFDNENKTQISDHFGIEGELLW